MAEAGHQTIGRQKLYGFDHVDAAEKLGKLLLDTPAAAPTFLDATATLRRFEYLTDSENYGKRIFTGAVYDADGGLIEESLRSASGVFRHAPDARIEPDSIEAAHEDAEAVYLGSYMSHFGHFLLEVLPRTWILEQHPGAPVYFHPWRGSKKAEAGFQREFLNAAAGGQADVRVIRDTPVRFRRLIIPQSQFLISNAGSPAFGDWCSKIAGRLAAEAPPGPRPERIYLSRTRLVNDKRKVGNEAWVEDYFAAKGFSIIHPQEHSLAEQMALMRGCKVLAGTVGSAMHLALFMPRGSSVITLDAFLLPSQHAIEAVCDHHALHLFVLGIRNVSLWAYEERMAEWEPAIDELIAAA